MSDEPEIIDGWNPQEPAEDSPCKACSGFRWIIADGARSLCQDCGDSRQGWSGEILGVNEPEEDDDDPCELCDDTRWIIHGGDEVLCPNCTDQTPEMT